VPETLLYSFAFGLSVCTFSLYVYSVYAEYKSRPKDAAHFFEEAQRHESAFFMIVKPPAAFFGHFIALAARRLESRFGRDGVARYLNDLRVRVQRSLVCAGSPESLTADEYLGLFLVSVLFWGAVGATISLAGGSSLFFFLTLIAGILHPWLWLRKKVTQRQNGIRNLLPYALDLLTLSVEAGLDFSTALERITPKLGTTALAEEFGELVRQMRLGRPRAEALREMADRVHMPDVNTFCSSLIQADELGSDLGPVLRLLGGQMRDERANRAEKKAMEAPVKILFPLIAFIFPTVFIILFAPLGIRYLQDLFAG